MSGAVRDRTPIDDDRRTSPQGAVPPDVDGPVDPIGYLIEAAAREGVDASAAMQLLVQRSLDRVTASAAAGDVEGVHSAAESLADIARFVRAAREPPKITAHGPLEAERHRFVTLLAQRTDSMQLWIARTKRLANTAIKIHHDRPFWPGRGATLASETWQTVDNSLSVITTLATNLPHLVEGAEKDPKNVLDIRMTRANLGRLARELRNIIEGGRRDTARGNALTQVVGIINVALTLLVPTNTDEEAASIILSHLADSYGSAFAELDVIRAACSSIKSHRSKGQIAAIAADIVWAAHIFCQHRKEVGPELFRFPIQADRRRVADRRALMQDFAKARRPPKSA